VIFKWSAADQAAKLAPTREIDMNDFSDERAGAVL